MGETPNQPFQLSFNPSLKVDFQGSRVTSDGGLLLVRELDERLGLNELIEEHLTDERRGKNTQLPLPDLLRQSIYSRLARYEDVNDAVRLSQDPTFRLFAATFGEDRGTVGQARPVLLAAAGREPSEPAAVRGDAGADRAPAGSDGIGDAGPVCRRIGL